MPAPQPEQQVLILRVLLPIAADLVGERARVVAVLQPQTEGYYYLRLELRSGKFRGKEVSVHCKIRLSSTNVCRCDALPYPHKALSIPDCRAGKLQEN